MTSGVYQRKPEELERCRNLHKFVTKEIVEKRRITRRGKYSGSENHNWKGDKAGYQALHIWIRNKLGKATKCSINPKHKSKKYQWGNISGEYKRDLSDWREVCASCNKLDGIPKAKRFSKGGEKE